MTAELQPKLWSEEPIRQSANLLRRIAFVLLFGAAPAFSPYSRRSLFLFGTIGGVLLILASVIEGKLNLRRLATPSTSLLVLLIAGFVYIFWSGLSLAWTPFPGESGGRYANFVTILLTGFILILVLPDRVGASRLYGLSGGVTIGWIMALGISFAPDVEIDYSTLLKGLMLLILLTPPTMVWLIYRRRDLLALILVLLASSVIISLHNIMMSIAFGTAILVFLISLAIPERARKLLSYGLGLLILFAPIIPVLFTSLITVILGADAPLSVMFESWSRIVIDEPFRMLTGHGYDTILRAAKAGLIPPDSPQGLLVDAWFELGIIGALALAAIVVSLVTLSGTMTRPSAAAMLASLAAASVIGIAGGNLPQPPWLASLALAALAIAAVERGQYKTARPRSRDIAMLNAEKPRFSLIPHWLQF